MSDSRLKELQDTVREQFQQLCAEFPEQRSSGLTLFLGRHYAHPGSDVLMLGLNPGLREELPEDYDLQSENYLLGDPTEVTGRQLQYWRDARRCFGASLGLENKMELATFSFCCPFRTPNWSSVRPPLRRALERHSQPILDMIFRDCRPRFVVVAGKTAASLCAHLAPINVDEPAVSEGGHGRYQWRHWPGTAPWGSVSLLEVPHFSRFNSKQGLRECGLWLARLLV